MTRPSVDVVVPFVGTDDDLLKLTETVSAIALAPGDTIVIADNRPSAVQDGARHGAVQVIGAAGQPSSYFARNRGAERGSNPWLVFIDADVVPEPDLVERYFDPPVKDGTGVLIGGIYDAPPDPQRPSAVEQYSFHRGAVGHETAAGNPEFTFAQTANAAVLREAFVAVGGFSEGIRSGGDADLCFRVRNAGYEMEPRHEARVLHRNRTSLKAFVRQYARYGSGAAWLQEHHPGFAPRPKLPRLALSLVASLVRTVASLARGRRTAAQVYALDGVQHLAFNLGRRASNRVDR